MPFLLSGSSVVVPCTALRHASLIKVTCVIAGVPQHSHRLLFASNQRQSASFDSLFDEVANHPERDRRFPRRGGLAAIVSALIPIITAESETAPQNPLFAELIGSNNVMHPGSRTEAGFTSICAH